MKKPTFFIPKLNKTGYVHYEQLIIWKKQYEPLKNLSAVLVADSR